MSVVVNLNYECQQKISTETLIKNLFILNANTLFIYLKNFLCYKYVLNKIQLFYKSNVFSEVLLLIYY